MASILRQKGHNGTEATKFKHGVKVITFVKILPVVTHVIKGPWFVARGVTIITIIINNSSKLFNLFNQFIVKNKSKFSKWKMLIQGQMFPFVVYCQVFVLSENRDVSVQFTVSESTYCFI